MKKSLRWQILVPFLALILLTGTTIAVIGYMFSYNSSVKQSTNQMLGTMGELNHSFEIFFENIEEDLNMMGESTLVNRYNAERHNETLVYFGEYKENHKNIMNAYMGTTAGEMILYPVQDLPSDYDPRVRPWYEKAMENKGQVIWTEAYHDAATNSTVISAAKAVESGVVSLDIEVSKLVELTSQIKFGETGYAAIIDGNGKFLVHPREDFVGKEVTNEEYYIKMQEAGETGIVKYTLEGEEKALSFVTNPTTGWKMVGAVNLSEFEELANGILVAIVIALGVTIIVAFVVSIFVTNRIVSPIKRLQESMKKVEDGDLTVYVELNRKDELGQLTTSFNNMVEEIREVVEEVENVSHSILDSSQTLAGSSEENLAAANQVSETMQQIATGSSNQSQLVDSNTSLIHSFSEKIEQIQSQNSTMVDQSNTMLKASEAGMYTVKELFEQSNKVNTQIQDMTKAINSLDQRSNDISEIVTTITEIANQTNLLALNAAIESARAGEHGKGFAVVANEVRNLAEQTEKSLEQITKLISTMQTESKDTVKLIGETNSVMQEQNKTVSETENSFTTIKQVIQENSQISNELFEAMKLIMTEKEELKNNMDSVNSITQETAAGTEEITASIEEQNASMHELTKLAEILSSHSENLQERLKRFVVNK